MIVLDIVSHGRYVTFHMAEVAVPRQMFQEILSLIARLRAPARASMNGTSGQMQRTTAEVCPLRAEQHVSARRRGQLATLTTCRARGRRFAIA
jgi:hypothetical protein